MSALKSVCFDLAPSSSGPGRYVASLIRELEGREFRVSVESASAGLRVGQLDPQPFLAAPSPFVGRSKGIVPYTPRVLLGAMRETRRRAALLGECSVEFYHAQDTGCEESPIAARLARVPIILGTFHTDPTYDLDRERSGFSHRLIERISNRCLHHAIAVSEETKRNWMRRTRISDHKVTVIHNGVCPETYKRRLPHREAKQRLGLPLDAVVVGAVGRVDRAKGHAGLVDAFARVAPSHPTAILVIAGDGPLRGQLEAQTRSLGVEQRVRMLGHCADVAGVYDALDVYAMPSLCEALPFALLEAMAHGLPAVTSTAGGMPEVVVDGQTGRLVEVNDTEALAAALSCLCASSELRQEYGGAGQLRVEKHFTERQMVQKTMNLYDRLIDRRLRSCAKS